MNKKETVAIDLYQKTLYIASFDCDIEIMITGIYNSDLDTAAESVISAIKPARHPFGSSVYVDYSYDDIEKILRTDRRLLRMLTVYGVYSITCKKTSNRRCISNLVNDNSEQNITIIVGGYLDQLCEEDERDRISKMPDPSISSMSF